MGPAAGSPRSPPPTRRRERTRTRSGRATRRTRLRRLPGRRVAGGVRAWLRAPPRSRGRIGSPPPKHGTYGRRAHAPRSVCTAVLRSYLSACRRVRPRPRPRSNMERAELVRSVGDSTTGRCHPHTDPPAHSSDPDDDYLIALASAHGSALVSGDKRLLALADETPCSPPRAFLELPRRRLKHPPCARSLGDRSGWWRAERPMRPGGLEPPRGSSTTGCAPLSASPPARTADCRPHVQAGLRSGRRGSTPSRPETAALRRASRRLPGHSRPARASSRRSYTP